MFRTLLFTTLFTDRNVCATHLPAVIRTLFFTSLILFCGFALIRAEDPIRELQNQAVQKNVTPLGHWGNDPENYTQWGSHSSRLIPVYTFGTKGAGTGIDLSDYTGANSPYRSEEALRKIYGVVPSETVSIEATYCDQTNLAEIQKQGLAAGKKHIFLVVFDGMDWQTTLAAATYRNGKVTYKEGRGNGLHFQDYAAGGNTQYGWMVTSPSHGGGKTNVNDQTVSFAENVQLGGYAPQAGGLFPWSRPEDINYPIGKSNQISHAYPDSAETATAMMSGVKTYNGSISIEQNGAQATTVAHLAQEQGYGVGVVTSVPISHATPASAYAHNVSRNDYQDITRDLVGLPSVSHPQSSLPGLDVVLGAGFGESKPLDPGQGSNYVAGNRYLSEDDLKTIDRETGGSYFVATRKSGVAGEQGLKEQSQAAKEAKGKLFGFYGVEGGHLPFQTADGDYQPALGRKKKAEKYTPADISENPTLSQMTAAAIDVLSVRPKGFWLLVEAGDVDWANHDNNLDNSIGAVFNGDEAIKVITDWVETNSNWDESLMIVTADHGHFLFLDQPELIAAASAPVQQTVPALMSHRGMNRMAPENTLPAFEAALELGFDIELDVYLTTDGELVVIHDETVDRTTEGTGKIYEKSFDEVRKLDAGSWFAEEFRGLRVPTLGEVFHLIKAKQQRPTTIAVNLKIISPGMEKRIAREVSASGLRDQVFCFMMDAESNDRFLAADSSLRTSSMTTGFRGWDLRKPEDFSQAIKDDQTTDMWLNYLPTSEQIAAAHEAGKKVWVYTGNDRDLMQRAARSQLDGICSDFVLEIQKSQREPANQ